MGKLEKKARKAAVRYLDNNGFEVLDEKWTCPDGSIDVVAIDGGTLVFVEVSVESRPCVSIPASAPTPEKMGQRERMACWYMREAVAKEGFAPMPVRFDDIAIMLSDESHALLRHQRDVCLSI